MTSQDNRKQETKAVKDALSKAGFQSQVTHGKGTAWGWLDITLIIPKPKDCTGEDPFWCNTCRKAMEDAEKRAKPVILQACNRQNDERVLIQARFNK